jgi:hypothetical protein
MRSYLFSGAALVSALVMLPATGKVLANLSNQAPAGNPAPAVAIDFRVVANDGQPILDLKREDVALKVG